jgi:hypothetical protein
MDVVLEPDATPLVRIIAKTLRDSTADAGDAHKAERLRGVFALRSEKDPQAVTMRFERGRVTLHRGVAPDAQVVVTADLDNMSGPDAAKPKVQGALRHPLFALGVSKLLEPKPRPWTEHAHAFWAFARERPGMPEQLRVVCIDDGSSVDLGNTTSTDADACYEIHGSAPALVSIFSGGSVFGQDLLDGKVYAIGSLRHTSIVTGGFLDWMMRGAA